MNNIRPSCSFDITCSTLSFSAEKIWLVSRIWRPRWAIFNDTSPTSSWPDSSSGKGAPALAVSRSRDRSRDRAPHWKPWTPVPANKDCQHREETRLLQSWRQSIAQKHGRDSDPNAAKRWPSISRPIRASYTVAGCPYSNRNWCRKAGVSQHAQRRTHRHRLAIETGLVSRIATPPGSMIAAS